MKTVGVLTAISRRGELIVKLKEGYRGEKVAFDFRGSPVGEVRRVTGPVNSPYLILRCLLKDPNQLNRLLGRELFLGPESVKRRRVRRKLKESERDGRRRV